MHVIRGGVGIVFLIVAGLVWVTWSSFVATEWSRGRMSPWWFLTTMWPYLSAVGVYGLVVLFGEASSWGHS